MIIKARQISLINLVVLASVVLGLSCNYDKQVTAAHVLINQTLVADTNMVVNQEELVLKQLEGKWYCDDKAYSGVAVTYHSNGALHSSITYSNGKKHGEYQKWYPDGILQKEAFYQENKLNGFVYTWWSNGQLNSESHYKKGVRDGIQKRWYSNGQLSRKMTIVDGKEEGMQQAWLENGKIYVNYEARNGRSFGLKKANLCYELEEEAIKN
ncbi:MAG: toxin-antitoxin system YwqK family antitoxin [bacterium]